jgi:hypothetical protein
MTKIPDDHTETVIFLTELARQFDELRASGMSDEQILSVFKAAAENFVAGRARREDRGQKIVG